MKQLAWIPLTVIAVAAAGYGWCVAAGWDPHWRAMGFAAAAAFIASVAACVPVILTRGATQGTVAQAALAGTVLQMVLTLFLGGAAWTMLRPADRNGLLWWLLADYLVTLAVVSAVLIGAVRTAPPEPRNPTPKGPAGSPPAQ